MSIRYAFITSVIAVEEKFQQVNWHLDKETGKPTCEEVSLGWFVRYTDSSAIWLGNEKPELKVGDRIKVMLEKV